MKSNIRTLKPVVVMSRCLGIEACRYNGKMIREDFIHHLSSFVKIRPVCPELEIGLGVPRDPILIVAGDGGARTLIQPATGRDLTERMNAFSQNFLEKLNEVDGFILKSRSPSCGIRDTRIYGADQETVLERGAGMFAAAVLNRFPDLPVEDEKRLRNRHRREHFLTRLYALARLRRIARRPTRKALSRFHAANRLLLMAYNRTELDQLDKTLSDGRQPDAAVLAKEYKTAFIECPFPEPPLHLTHRRADLRLGADFQAVDRPGQGPLPGSAGTVSERQGSRQRTRGPAPILGHAAWTKEPQESDPFRSLSRGIDRHHRTGHQETLATVSLSQLSQTSPPLRTTHTRLAIPLLP